MGWVRQLAIIYCCLFLLCACTSGDKEESYNPRIPAAAYAADSFASHAAPPEHPDWKPVEFFFKTCSQTGHANHFSKTEYQCSYP